jgi:hypothetical protein
MRECGTRMSSHVTERGEMKMQKKFVVVATVLASSVGIVADGYAACDKMSCRDVVIERLYIRSDDAIEVSTTGKETDLNCVPQESIYLRLNRGHVNQSEIYAAMLSAKLANHEIWIRIRENPGGPCEIAYVVLE